MDKKNPYTAWFLGPDGDLFGGRTVFHAALSLLEFLNPNETITKVRIVHCQNKLYKVSYCSKRHHYWVTYEHFLLNCVNKNVCLSNFEGEGRTYYEKGGNWHRLFPPAAMSPRNRRYIIRDKEGFQHYGASAFAAVLSYVTGAFGDKVTAFTYHRGYNSRKLHMEIELQDGSFKMPTLSILAPLGKPEIAKFDANTSYFLSSESRWVRAN